MILKAFAAVRQVLSNSFLGRGTSWAWRAEDVGRFDGEEKLRAGGLATGGTLSALWSLSWTRRATHRPWLWMRAASRGLFLITEQLLCDWRRKIIVLGKHVAAL